MVTEVVTEAVTEKGRQRRAALVEAASRLVVAHGPDAVTARAVAREAGVPLAAVTYYFADVDALAREGALRSLAEHVEHARTLVRGVRFGASDRVLAERVVGAALGPAATGGAEAVAALYRRSLAVGRRPGWTRVFADWDDGVLDVVRDLLSAAGRDAAAARVVLAVTDGLAVSAVVRGVDEPVRDVVRDLAGVLPSLTR